LPPKRQHFIPILHLKHFAGADPKGQVWTYDAESGEVRSATPENTAVQTHFYSVEGEDGVMDTRVEDCLAEIESHAAPVYEALLRAEIPAKGTQARADFASFLAVMYSRTPAMRRISGELTGRLMQSLNYAYGSNEQAFEAILRRAEENGARPLNSEEKERLRGVFLDPSKYVIQIAKERTFPAIFGLAVKLAPILGGMKWSIVQALHGFFITTDNPLVRGVDPKTHHPIYGDDGFFNETAQVIFPLSPHRLLFMSWNENASDIGSFERDRVNRIDHGLAAHSDRYLYSHIRHKRLEEMAAKFKNSRPGITTQGFGPKKFAKVEVPRRMKTR
jgi:Protein of unknown function (DUF4238)